jgi:hypothetical protein
MSTMYIACLWSNDHRCHSDRIITYNYVVRNVDKGPSIRSNSYFLYFYDHSSTKNIFTVVYSKTIKLDFVSIFLFDCMLSLNGINLSKHNSGYYVILKTSLFHLSKYSKFCIVQIKNNLFSVLLQLRSNKVDL